MIRVGVHDYLLYRKYMQEIKKNKKREKGFEEILDQEIKKLKKGKNDDKEKRADIHHADDAG